MLTSQCSCILRVAFGFAEAGTFDQIIVSASKVVLW